MNAKQKYELLHGDCLRVLVEVPLLPFDCIFADPPDNIGLSYVDSEDDRPENEYITWLETCFRMFIVRAPITWISYNAKWQFRVGEIVSRLLREFHGLRAKQCVQVFTFGQHNQRDLGNNYRPLLRLMREGTKLYPEQIRVPSARQLVYGDKRADPRGRIPGDVFESLLGAEEMSVFDFPRIVGNSKQRRSWHPTQLHEGLVERCILMSTRTGTPGARVLDPFAGTGTTLRVCRRIGRCCTLIESSAEYCRRLALEHELDVIECP